MKPFGTLGIAALLTATMATSAFATSGDEAETIIKDNTYNSANAGAAAVNHTQVGVQTGAAAHNNTHVGVKTGDNTLNNSTELENTNNLNNQNHLTTGNNTNENENTNNLNNQNHLTTGNNTNDNRNENENTNNNSNDSTSASTSTSTTGDQSNSQNTSYNSTYKAAASSAYGHAPTVIPGSKCGLASSWGFGAQVIGGGLSLSGGSSDPAGVQIRYVNDDGKEAVASLESYATGTDVYKAEVTDKLSSDKRDQVECLAGEFNNREDGQQHQKEMAVIGAHVTRVENASAHACRPDAKHVGHDCIDMGDVSLDTLNQMIGFEPKTSPAPAHSHN